jgi:replication fork clamp-binding protein CrfC
MSMKIKPSEKPGKTDGTRETLIKEEMELDIETLIVEPTNECRSTSWVYWRRDAQKLETSTQQCKTQLESCHWLAKPIQPSNARYARSDPSYHQTTKQPDADAETQLMEAV